MGEHPDGAMMLLVGLILKNPVVIVDGMMVLKAKNANRGELIPDWSMSYLEDRKWVVHEETGPRVTRLGREEAKKWLKWRYRNLSRKTPRSERVEILGVRVR